MPFSYNFVADIELFPVAEEKQMSELVYVKRGCD